MARRRNRTRRRRSARPYAGLLRDIDLIAEIDPFIAETFATSALMIASARELAAQWSVQTSNMARVENMGNATMSRCVREILGGTTYYNKGSSNSAYKAAMVESVQREIRDQPVVT